MYLYVCSDWNNGDVINNKVDDFIINSYNI